MTQHLTAYCQFAEHIHCLNPATLTINGKEGGRFVKRDENRVQKTYYYVMSAKAAAVATKTQPVQTDLTFDTAPTDAWIDGQPF